MTHARRLIWVALSFCSMVLLASSIFRAFTYPFVHDESLSFAIFNWDPWWGGTVNNHLLNTFLMKLCSTLFGNSELSLRLPNILAHAAYLIIVLLFLRRIQSASLQVAGFIAFNFNPFVLDFFFLARGYGLALAAETAGCIFSCGDMRHGRKPGTKSGCLQHL